MTTDNRRHLRPIEDLACGATAGGLARLVVAPFDVLKIRYQVQVETKGLYCYNSLPSAVRNMLRHEGVTAFWKGNCAALLMVVPYASLQFAAFYQLKQAAVIRLAEPYQSLTLGAMACMFATACTYPLDLLRTRFAAQVESRTYTSLYQAIGTIYAREGFPGFFAGIRPTLVEIVPYMSLQFATYEAAKRKVLQSRRSETLAPLHSMAIGAVTGTTSKLITLPLDNAKKRMQVQGQFWFSQEALTDPSKLRYSGTLDVLRKVFHTEGFKGLYRGVSPSLIKAAPNSAVTFAAYEYAKSFLLARRPQ